MTRDEIKALIERARIASVSVDTNDGGRNLFFHLAEEMEKLVAVAEKAAACAKPFPMQGGPSIPWDLAENIYAAYAALFGTAQSIERMAQRGGFGWAEVETIGKDLKRKFRAPEGWNV